MRLGPTDDATVVTAAQLHGVVERLIHAGQWEPGDPEIFIIVTEPLGEARAKELIPNGGLLVAHKNVGHYVRLTPDIRLAFGGRARFAPSNPASDIKGRAMPVFQDAFAHKAVEFRDILKMACTQLQKCPTDDARSGVLLLRRDAGGGPQPALRGR